MADEYLAELQRARAAPAVMKVRFANLRAIYTGVVFVFEGVDDKSVYFNWIQKINPELRYEPFLCLAKTQVLQLFDTMERDLTGMGDNVFYFVDRDFDDLQGRSPSTKLFMTEGYSIENYLVTREVLDNLLLIELHCHGRPDVRSRVIETFEQVYDVFLEVTSSINCRLFAARRLGIELRNDLPDRLNKIATVLLDDVKASGVATNQTVELVREPSREEISLVEREFSLLIPRGLRFRGKFVILFFRAWLNQLLADRNSPNSRFFQGISEEGLVARCQFQYDILASKRTAPVELARFINQNFPRTTVA